MHKMSRVVLAVGVAGVTALVAPSGASAGTSGSCPLPRFGPGSSYHPTIRPADFSAYITNPWLPMPVGTTFVYTGAKDGKQALDVVTVSRKTRKPDGVTARVVLDRLFLDNVLEEGTSDYYAQDKCGNVWSFGEDTAELDKTGKVTDTAGSFHAG